MHNTNSIRLNFLEVSPKVFNVRFYYKRLDDLPIDERAKYYQKNLKLDANDFKYESYAITFNQTPNFDEKVVSSQFNVDITKQFLFVILHETLKNQELTFEVNLNIKYHRVFLPIKSHVEGSEQIWLEPHFLESKNIYGFLIDYKFSVDINYQSAITGSVNKKILQLSGTLDNKGYSNRAFYQFKYGKVNEFFNIWFSRIQYLKNNEINFKISSEFIELDAYSLNSKTYQFQDNKESNSSYIGLKNSSPFKSPEVETDFIFLFKSTDRLYAINLLNGLKGTTYQNTFSGIESMFKIPFNNQNIIGKKVDALTDEVFLEVVNDIKEKKLLGKNSLPIILTNSHGSDIDDKLYFTIKHTFTKENIPCQVVTKDLVIDSGALKYSLSNIGLQIFAKSGGMPWKIKPAIKQCIIIGIGTKNKEVQYTNESGIKTKKIEKFLTYSVLTDSSGLFKEIQILSEADNEIDYYNKLINKLKSIILKSIAEGNEDIVIHAPFKISKKKVWDVLFLEIPNHVNISVILINDHHKFFGYDFSKNALVPYESSMVKLSGNEYLVWFEGLQYNNAPFNKLVGNPIYINFWYSNKIELLKSEDYRNNLLQDCINLSGANWRGFKAKQLPVSIFYCQQIAKFLMKFEAYDFSHIEIQNLKPWFL